MPETWERHLPAVERDLALLVESARRNDAWARAEEISTSDEGKGSYTAALWIAAAVVLVLIWGLW